ncbi:hypothetical protein CCR94_18550 [Rhodoblastus sphagnicola]|uniref:DUF1638 domain-containing protein n=1 Tax=Rhodoblastus sphagnicola TaxID=333368 RepID=A0A2S6N0N4_9HYPH|nr:DUF1638 domain-containing protein [Rhodoblastus sphagnicola]MBB4200466.1 hypothetical protein [Rhodoblastus sphagnicola]PPQ28181.1 hypothetical protein CCR94_18550 [Rhodoblastus sphagnicola]
METAAQVDKIAATLPNAATRPWSRRQLSSAGLAALIALAGSWYGHHWWFGPRRTRIEGSGFPAETPKNEDAQTMSTLLLACEVMREELLRIPTPPTTQLEFLSMGLHTFPLRLRDAIAEELAKSRGFERVILGFGLCGNALDSLISPHAPLVVPRVHDCIPLLAGGPLTVDGPALEKGVFYLSGGWMEGKRTLASEHQRAVRSYGETRALRVLNTMLDGYHGFVFLRTDHPRREQRQQEAQALADRARLPLEIFEARRGRLERLINGPWDGSEFLHFPAGAPITAAAFGP